MSLKEAKGYLRIDYDDEDSLIEDLIEVSDVYIESCVGTAYKQDEKAIKLSKLLQKKIIYSMHKNRSVEVPTNIKNDMVVTTILDKLSTYTEDN